MEVTEILCSFRLVLEWKTGKEIPESSRLEFLETFSANNFALSDTEDKTSRLLNRGGVADLPLLRMLMAIHQKSRKASFWEVMDPFVILEYVSLAASRTLLQQLLTCLKFTLDSEDLSIWYKQKWFLWAMAAAQAAENHGYEWCLSWYFWCGIYTSIPNWTQSQNSLAAAAEALSLRYSPMEDLSNNHKDHPNQHKNSLKAMQWSKVFCCEYDGTSKETETAWSEFPNGGKAIVEQILVSEEINPTEQDCENHIQGYE